MQIVWQKVGPPMADFMARLWENWVRILKVELGYCGWFPPGIRNTVEWTA